MTTPKDRSIIRQTCIKAAAEFCVGKTPEEVLKQAADFEKWVLEVPESTSSIVSCPVCTFTMGYYPGGDKDGKKFPPSYRCLNCIKPAPGRA